MINNFKSENGSITVYVLVAMLFLLAIITAKYILANRQLETQVVALDKIRNVYSQPNVSSDDSDSGGGETSSDGIVPPTIDDSNISIPIYNGDAYSYFKTWNQQPYYIYQEGACYVGGKDKKYVLMSDITVNISGYDFYSDLLARKIDFNNHVIYTNDGYYYYGYMQWGNA